ncbi:MAG: twin-arginine translocase TatA/TatE family subunit [Vulcanimicrobiota bacterium]
MFNIGPSEMMLLGLLALLVFGPSRLPEIAKAAGEGLRAFRKAASDLKAEVSEVVESEVKANRPQPAALAVAPPAPAPAAPAPVSPTADLETPEADAPTRPMPKAAVATEEPPAEESDGGA